MSENNLSLPPDVAIRAFSFDVPPVPLSGFAVPEKGMTVHGACGRGWWQHGNRTGHCSQCHEVFEGINLFDAHQARSENGSVVCLDPSLMLMDGVLLRLVGGSWRRAPIPEGTWAA